MSTDQRKPRHLLLEILKNTGKNGSCLEWQGAMYVKKDKSAWRYPQISHQGKAWRGNRLVLFLATGEIPIGLCALHKCDNSICINPKHLYWGTHQQNAQDTVKRNRHPESLKTKCAFGHPYSSENTVYYRGKRYCLSCRWYRSHKMEPQKDLKIYTPKKYKPYRKRSELGKLNDGEKV